MDAIAKVLVQQTYLDIFSSISDTAIDIKGWIANQNYFVDHVTSSSNFHLRSANRQYLMNALANDCNRMAMAAVECICGIKEDATLKKSGAWGVIRLYYACFFAAHSILRIFGTSCSYLNLVHINKIYESAKLVGEEGKLSNLGRGFYTVAIDRNYLSVIFKKNKDTHKDTWGEFLILLDKLIDESRNATALSKYKLDAIDLLSEIKRGITRSGCRDKGNWLSKVRNLVNYQHSHGVWYPYERKAIALPYIRTISEEWKNPLEDNYFSFKRSDVELYFELCLMIIRFFRELIVACAQKAPTINPVFSKGTLRLLNTLKAA